MEQRPFIADWRKLTDCPDVIVVPFFISDGLHSFEDIPVLLKITEDAIKDGFPVPFKDKGKRLWYATAVGTESLTADVILSQIDKFNRDHRIETVPKVAERVAASSAGEGLC